MVDDLYGRCEQQRDTIEVDMAGERCDRARRRRGAVALGAFWETLGVALVEPHDGVTQVIDGENLGRLASALRVHLDQMDLLLLVRADVETAARKAAGAERNTTQRQRVAEGCQRFMVAGGVLSESERAPRRAQRRAVPRRVGDVVHGSRIVS